MNKTKYKIYAKHDLHKGDFQEMGVFELYKVEDNTLIDDIMQAMKGVGDCTFSFKEIEDTNQDGEKCERCIDNPKYNGNCSMDIEPDECMSFRHIIYIKGE